MKLITTLVLLSILGTTAAAQDRVPSCEIVIPTTTDAQLKGYDTIAFKVVNDTAPISGAPVQLYQARKLVLSFRTDKDGMFSLSKLAPGDYKLIVRGWGQATVQIAPLSKVKFVVNEFTLYAPKQGACPKFVGGIDR